MLPFSLYLALYLVNAFFLLLYLRDGTGRRRARDSRGQTTGQEKA
jgi:hypothetical protein